jgi:hypothetical protein
VDDQTPTFAVLPRERLMLPTDGNVPAGVPTCSRGCHVLLFGALFDPHTGEAIPGSPEAAPPPSLPAEPFDFTQLERELHEVVAATADGADTVRSLVAAVGEYGEHLRSHTAVMRALAETTDHLRAVTADMRDVLTGASAPAPPALPRSNVVLVIHGTAAALVQWQRAHLAAPEAEPLLRVTTDIVAESLALAAAPEPTPAQATALFEGAHARIEGDGGDAARRLAAILFGALTVLKSKRF